jgi:two-component system NtrC family sensor kinase
VGHEVKRIDSIVTRLLNFARPARASLVTLHLHDVLRDSLRLVGQQLKRSGIHLKESLDSEEDCIHGDADLLGQAFVDFFLNAQEAMSGGGTLTVATSLVESRWHAARTDEGWEGARVRLSITDTGCGIEEDALTHIFDPFYTTKSNGTGLGLSVSHGIISEHGASIDVESDLEVGTTFHLLFPLAAVEATV